MALADVIATPIELTLLRGKKIGAFGPGREPRPGFFYACSCLCLGGLPAISGGE